MKLRFIFLFGVFHWGDCEDEHDKLATSYNSLRTSYVNLQLKMRKYEEMCGVNLKDMEDKYDFQDFEREEDTNSKLDKILTLSMHQVTAIHNLTSEFRRFRSEDIRALSAEIMKVGNLHRQADDGMAKKMDNAVQEMKVIYKEVSHQKVFFEETFTKDWIKRWESMFPGTVMNESYSMVNQVPGTHFENRALKSKNAMSYQKGILARFPEFSSKTLPMVIQYSLKFALGEMFLRLHDCPSSRSILGSWDQFSLFFGNKLGRRNGGENQLLLKFREGSTWFDHDQYLSKIKGPTDRFTHVYTLEILPDNYYAVYIDDELMIEDRLKIPFFGFPSICAVSMFNQENPLAIEIDNILITSDLDYAKEKRTEILSFMKAEREYEFDIDLRDDILLLDENDNIIEENLI